MGTSFSKVFTVLHHAFENNLTFLREIKETGSLNRI